MAGGKETPRQKMIGLMYLVLMALLAMNVSKDILESFLVINEGLERSTGGLTFSTANIYNTLKTQSAVNPEKVGPFWEQARQVQSRADQLVHQIDSIKKVVIAATEKIELAVADTLDPHHIEAKDNYDIPTYLLVGEKEDGSAGLAAVIRKDLHAFSEFLYSSNLFAETDPQPFSIYDTAKYQGQSWEIHNFYHAPLMASVSILSKLENDVRAAEFKAINRLFGQINIGTIQFDTLGAQAIAESNYVVRGDSFSTNIFLGAFNRSLQPTVIVGKIDSAGNLIEAYDTVLTAAGMANYRAAAKEVGEHECNGIIEMMDDDGEVSKFPFRSKYQVFQPSAVVSADKMNVMYIGPDNPVSVSVPGYSDADTRVTISGGNTLRKTGEGKYIAVLRNGSPRDVMVNVAVKTSSGEWMPMGGQQFRTKKLPRPYAVLSGQRGVIKMSKARLTAERGLRAEFDRNFIFKIDIKVTDFDVEVYSSQGPGQLMPSNKNRFTAEQTNLFAGLRKGNRVYLKNVKGRDELGNVYSDLGEIAIEIIR